MLLTMSAMLLINHFVFEAGALIYPLLFFCVWVFCRRTPNAIADCFGLFKMPLAYPPPPLPLSSLRLHSPNLTPPPHPPHTRTQLLPLVPPVHQRHHGRRCVCLSLCVRACICACVYTSMHMHSPPLTHHHHPHRPPVHALWPRHRPRLPLLQRRSPRNTRRQVRCVSYIPVTRDM